MPRTNSTEIPSSNPGPAGGPLHDGLPVTGARDSNIVNTVIKRGRGLSNSSSLQRQRSVQGIAGRSHTVVTDNGLPPQIPVLRRSPSHSQSNSPHGPRSQSTSRSLSRSQSNISLFQSTPSSPVSETPVQDPFPLRDGAPVLRKNSIPHPNAVRLQTRPSMPSSETPSPALSRATSSTKLQTLRVDTSRLPGGQAPAESLAQSMAPGVGRHPGSTSDSPQIRHVPVLEIVLGDLFRAFANQADTKIHNCAESRLRLSVRIEDICGPGVDLSFDQLLVNMGFVAKSNPKVLIDKVMNWKRMHDEPRNPTNVASKSANHPADPVKRSVDLHRVNDTRTASAASNRTNTNVPAYSPDAELAERKASAASYILCRTLIDVLSQTTLDALTKPIAVTLANIAFENTVNRVSQDEMVRSSIERAKFAKAVELLGVLSVLDFGGVVGRYTLALKDMQTQLGDKGYANLAAERHAFNLLRGLRSLQPRVDSDMSWLQISGGIQSLVDLFMGVHGEQSKIEYCLTITILLLRTASSSQTTFDDNKWRKMIGELHARLGKMNSKPKYWPISYPTQVALACVSPKDIFQMRWQTMIDTAPKYLRERHTRLLSLKAICRMTWCFLRRKHESEGTLIKSIEDLARIVFFSGRKFLLSRDSDTVETLIQLVRVIGSVLPSTCFTSIIFPLMDAESIKSARGANLQGLDPDRIIIGIRSFLALIEDIETQIKPAFPVRLAEDDEQSAETTPGPTSPAAALKGRPRKVSIIKGNRLSEPVATSKLSDAVQTHYFHFCELLSKLIKSCDNAFGGQASLDEKFSAPTAKTPFADAWNFAKREELLQAEDARLGFYDLLHVAVQALPRCLSPKHAPSNELLNLLCTGTAHVEKDIAASSAASLKSIARQGWAQEVVDRFSAFIFKYENRYATMSDGGQLGPGHIESTLHLYIDLLTVWVEELQRKRGNQGFGLPRLDVSTSQSYVDRAEAQGLFFMCSPSNRVRAFAVEVFELVTKLDSALGETNPRLLNVFSSSAEPMLHSNNSNNFSFKERAHLGKGIKTGNINAEILNLCKSSDREESALWAKVFPYVVSAANNLCYMTVSQTREDVCSRLSQLQPIIETPREERPRATTASTVDSTSSRGTARTRVTPADITIEQWKLYLIFACATITRIEPVTPMPSQDNTHTRQSSKSSQTGSEAMTNATDLLGNIVPLLFSDHPRIRAAAVVGLGSININLYKPLLECLARETRRQSGNARRHGTHARSSSSPPREWSGHVYVLEVVQVYEATSRFMQEPDVLNDESILDHLANVTREMSLYFTHGIHHHCLSMKAHYCGLVERFFQSINKSAAPSRWMAHQTRRAAYVQIEGWWDETQPGGALSQLHVHETQKLKIASASVMAALCAGPIDGFKIELILVTTDKMLKSDGDRLQNAGKKALQNLIRHNRHLPILFDTTVELLYTATMPADKTKVATLEAYLDILIEVSAGAEAGNIFPWKLMGILLYTLSNMNETIRMKSLRLLRILEEQQGHTENLRNYDIRVSDRTRAVNVAAQYNLVEEIIAHHEEYCYLVFSEYSKRLFDLPVDSQRSMIHIMLPWMKKLELRLDNNYQPNATTHMVLMNMLLITVKCETKLHHELQALWHALIDGKYPDNAKAVIDFVIGLALECKNESFIKTARQIAVYMASHEAGKGIYDYLLIHVEPKSMRGDEKRTVTQPQSKLDETVFVAPLNQIFESSTGSISLSIGQLCLILLVDLIVERYVVPLDKVPYLLHAVLVLWDHHLPIVENSAREMLVHLIHVLVISKVDKSIIENRQVAVEELVELIRNHDSKVSWHYNNNMNQFTPYELPQAMSFVVSETVSLFSMAIPGIGDDLGLTAVTWATNCVVRHQACRSWQIYRCLLTGLTPSLMSAMIFQMSGTVSDPHDDVQAYGMDIIRLFRTIAEDQHSEANLITQVFWTVCALLYSVHEHEFREAVCILGIVLDKCDAREPSVVQRLLAAKPHDFDEAFPGVARFVYNGCRSIYSCDDALVMLDRLLQLPPSPLVGDDSRLRLTLLANIPRLLHSFENPTVRADSLQATATLHDVCYAGGFVEMAHTLDQFRNGKFRNKREFLSSWVDSAKYILTPENLRDSFEFTMGMLHNQLPWMRWETLRVLDAIVPFLQPWSARLAAGGPGLFQPLLTLTQTEYCSEALRILDQLLPPASSADSALGRAATNFAALDRAEDGRDPYGQPGRTGWSVPNVDARRQLCRKNLESVHMATLAEGESFDSQQVTPGLEFQNDYFPARPETTIGELTAQLDEMDDFFELVTDTDGDMSDGSLISSPPQRSLDALEGHGPRPRFSPSPASSQVNVPTISRRNTGSQSNGYSNGVAHGPVYPPDSNNGNPQIMSPSAFAAPARTHGRLPSRPSILARSITMPVNEGLDMTTSQRLGTVPSSPGGETFSDDELQWSSGRRRHEMVDDGATMQPEVASKGTRFGLRSLSLKRLASTSGERHRRAQTAGTVRGPGEHNGDGPQVPKVPYAFLSNNPQSSEP